MLNKSYKQVRAPRMAKAAKFARGGAVHMDAAEDKKMMKTMMDADEVKDKAMVKKAIAQHDANMHGGKNEEINLKRGGVTRKLGKYA